MHPSADRTPPIDVLVVEDSPMQAQLLRRTLLKREYNVRLAANGALGLEAVQAQKPSLVISDVDMPEMDGYQLCQAIKTDRQLRGIPVILLTSLTDPDDILQGLHAKADNYVPKPYDEKVLFSRIDNLLLNRKMRQQGARGGIEVYRTRRKHTIDSDPAQILDLLMSSIDNAMLENQTLKEQNGALREKLRHLEAEIKVLRDQAPGEAP